jgi:hypothetical protein
LHYYHTESHTTPINRETAKLLATPPPGIDKTLWLYELCRFLIAQCNSLIVGFLFDTPPCSAATCPEMRAGEWQFLCAVHDTPKSCCAIDYCCHTLDWAANVVTNPKIFPSRFVVDAHDKNTALKNLVNVFRRLHRIFAHAWFQHRGVFWSLESQSGLYVFFKTVCDVYDLLPAENYKLPPEAEGLDSNAGANDVPDRSAERRQQQQQLLAPIAIAKPPSQRDSEDGDYSAMSRNNTRRHIKSSPSTGSAVTTVPEADEDDGSDLSHRLRQMRIATARAEAEEEGGDSANIPVIVEHRPLTTTEQPMRPSSVVPPPGATVFERQPASEQEPEPTKQEEPAPEHEFALEPEAPAPLPFRPKPEPESAEPVPESQLEPETKAEEEPSAAPVEDQHPPEEQPEPTTAAAATAEEPAPETKAADVEEQEASSTAAAEASEKDSAPSPVAEDADEIAAGAKAASDTAEEKEVEDQTEEGEEEETKEKKTEESVESTVQEAEALGSQGGAAEQEQEQEKEEETEAKAEPVAKAGSTKEEAEVVASPPEKEEKETEKEAEKEAEKGAEKETEKEEVEVAVAPKEEEKVEKKEEEEEAPKEEGADINEEAAPKEKQDDKAEEGKKTADEEKKSD